MNSTRKLVRVAAAMVLLFAGAKSALAQLVVQPPFTGIVVQNGVGPAGGALNFDIALNGVPLQHIPMSIAPNTSANDIANMLADQYNAVVGTEVASSSSGKVKVQSPYQLSIDAGTTPDLFRLLSAKPPVWPIPGMKLSMAPDFNSGINTLLADGQFGVEGPGGLSSFFTAPAGTTNYELANLFADAFNTVPAYSAYASGWEVYYFAPTVDEVFITVDGSPLEYDLQNVPEPGTLGLLALGGGLVALLARRRKHGIA